MRYAKDPWYGQDKILHLCVGLLISMIVSMLLDNIYIGIAASALIGLLKEVWDGHDGGTGSGFSYKDLVATILGGVLGAFLYVFMFFMIFMRMTN